MKTTVIILTLLSSAVWGYQPLDSHNRIFSIDDGRYSAKSKLITKSHWTPNPKIKATRVLKNQTITAETKAYVLGIRVAKARARLKIVPIDRSRFDILDLDAKNQSKVAGSGRCDSQGCHFEVTVMQGQLTLKESWRPRHRGFEVFKGSQIYKGGHGSYELSFK